MSTGLFDGAHNTRGVSWYEVKLQLQICRGGPPWPPLHRLAFKIIGKTSLRDEGRPRRAAPTFVEDDNEF